MVILPTEKRFDWKYPPVMLFSIVFLNVLVFLLYQSNDPAKLAQAQSVYVSSGLIDNEWNAYLTYLEDEKKDPEALQAVKEQREKNDLNALSSEILLDQKFYPFLLNKPDLIEFDPYDASDTWEHWRSQREKVTALVQSISTLRLGLSSSDLSPVTLITYQFLHGGLMHLLGNLFFLVLCGFAVEAAIGSFLFLFLYLASGVAGGLLFVLTDHSGGMPLIGASGAISGVMAMYLGIFRLRKIEFFYWIFIFAGYFRAPALLILPIYVGNEVISYFSDGDSTVAFMAHAGGFVGGAILTLAVHFIRPSLINREYVFEDQSSDPRREARAEFYKLVEEVNFPAALKQLAEIKQQFGLDFELLLQRFNLTRALGVKDKSGAFSDLMRRIPDGDHELARLADAWSSNPTLQGALGHGEKLELGLRFSTIHWFPLAEQIFAAIYQPGHPDKDVGIFARRLAIVFGERQDDKKRTHYSEIADTLLANVG